MNTTSTSDWGWPLYPWINPSFLFQSMGWQCPICNHVMAPTMTQCVNGNHSNITKTSADTGSVHIHTYITSAGTSETPVCTDCGKVRDD